MCVPTSVYYTYCCLFSSQQRNRELPRAARTARFPSKPEIELSYILSYKARCPEPRKCHHAVRSARELVQLVAAAQQRQRRAHWRTGCHSRTHGFISLAGMPRAACTRTHMTGRAARGALPTTSPPPAGCVRTNSQTGVFIPEKSNIWRDCCDGMYDWVKEHVMEVGRGAETARRCALLRASSKEAAASAIGFDATACTLANGMRPCCVCLPAWVIKAGTASTLRALSPVAGLHRERVGPLRRPSPGAGGWQRWVRGREPPLQQPPGNAFGSRVC